MYSDANTFPVGFDGLKASMQKFFPHYLNYSLLFCTQCVRYLNSYVLCGNGEVSYLSKDTLSIQIVAMITLFIQE